MKIYRYLCILIKMICQRSSVFQSYPGQPNLRIKFLYYTIFLPIKIFYIFSIFQLNFRSYILPFFGSIFVLALYHFLTHKKFLYPVIFRLNFRSYILSPSDSILILIFPHFLPLFTIFSHPKK